MLEITLPIKTVSEANRRDKWCYRMGRNGKPYAVAGYLVKAKRVKQQRSTTYLSLRANFGIFEKTQARILVELTRVASRKLDDDNLRSAFKAIRDGVAQWLNIDDGSEQITWTYAQEQRSKTNEVKLRIVSAE